MLARLSEGVTKLCCHPGYVDPNFDSEYHAERELELATLLDPRASGGGFDEAGISCASATPTRGWTPARRRTWPRTTP